MAIGKDRLSERLEANAIQFVERIAALESRPLRLVKAPETFEEAAEFEQEIESLEPLLFLLRRFLDQIAGRLEFVHLFVQEVSLNLTLVSGAAYQRTLHVPSPTRNVDTLFRMLYTHLENLRTNSAITAVRLLVKPSPPEAHQFMLFETSFRDPNQFSETLARVGALIGSERIGRPILEETHRPDAFHLQPVSFDSNENPARPSQVSRRLGLGLRRFRPAVSARLKQKVASRLFAMREVRGTRSKSGRLVAQFGELVEETAWAREEWDIQTRGGFTGLIARRRIGFGRRLRLSMMMSNPCPKRV
jgi:protein ImuB